MSICKRCGKDVVGIHTCTPPHEEITPVDPKARVVEIINRWREEDPNKDVRELEVISPGSRYSPNALSRLADRLASAGLLASAPVVPSAQELAEVLIEAKRIEEGFEKIAEIPKLPPEHPQMKRAQAIRNHLLTLGWREK